MDNLEIFPRLFLLSNYAKHNNTNLIRGSCCKRLLQGEDGERIFSGFVFRGDSRRPEIIFEQGFIPRGRFYDDISIDHRMDRMTGALNGGFTFAAGVSTSLSTRIAQYYVKLNTLNTDNIKYFNPLSGSGPGWCAFAGYIYLIDARDMAGYAIGVPEAYRNHPLLLGQEQAFLHEIYEVNFIHAIPNTSIVGIVWSDKHVGDDYRWSEEWMGQSGIELILGENPEYNGNAAKVAKLFNERNVDSY
ncbi:hypothetical protein [Candidatus Sororendozoicomonas aggregata]|uniref:hypothetical protein n=1 Tax=Candidatus Sororendozoicomonas aggregata TaxID=3073239 RepID=UPI002ED12E82